jgi:hypothetical protein
MNIQTSAHVCPFAFYWSFYPPKLSTGEKLPPESYCGVCNRDAAMEDTTIISVSTGTKCVNGEHMSEHGNSLNGKISAKPSRDHFWERDRLKYDRLAKGIGTPCFDNYHCIGMQISCTNAALFSQVTLGGFVIFVNP